LHCLTNSGTIYPQNGVDGGAADGGGAVCRSTEDVDRSTRPNRFPERQRGTYLFNH